MDLLGKLVWAIMFLWILALSIGLVIALLPIILVVVGFALSIAVFAFIGRLLASWIGY